MASYHTDAVEASASGRALFRFINVEKALNAISAERGPTNAFVAAPVQTETVASRLAAGRARSDTALSKIADDPLLARDAASIRSALVQARAVADEVAGRPPALRTPADIKAVVDYMVFVIDASRPIVDRALRPIAARLDSPIAHQAVTIRMMSDLRDYAGRMGSALMVPLATATPITEEQRSAFDQAQGRVLELRHLLSAASLGDDEAVHSALARVDERFFEDGMATYRVILQSGHEGRYAWDRDAFTQALLPGFTTLEQLRDVYSDRAQHAIEFQERHARWSFWAVATVTVVMMLFEGVLLVAAQRLIFRPLLAARDSVLELAAGIIEGPSSRTVVGEMGDLFGALGLLRQRLRERDMLDQHNTALAKQLRHLADRDGLTGILNRGALERSVQAHLDDPVGPATLGLILFDIDHFKAINDGHGHGVGDQVLQGLTSRLDGLMPPGVIFARFGGEEFAVVTMGAGLAEARTTAERLRRAVMEPVRLSSGIEILVTSSFGCAVAARGPDIWPTLIEDADAALYRAKRGGRNAVACAINPADAIMRPAAA